MRPEIVADRGPGLLDRWDRRRALQHVVPARLPDRVAQRKFPSASNLAFDGFRIIRGRGLRIAHSQLLVAISNLTARAAATTTPLPPSSPAPQSPTRRRAPPPFPQCSGRRRTAAR